MSVLKQESIKADIGEFSEISFIKAGELVADAKAHQQEHMLKRLIESMINRLKADDLTPKKRKEMVNGALYLIQMIHQQSLQMDSKDIDKLIHDLSDVRFKHPELPIERSQAYKDIEREMYDLRHHYSKICRKHMTYDIVVRFLEDVTKIRAILDSADRNDISDSEVEHRRERIRTYYLKSIMNSLDRSLKALESTSHHLLKGFTNIEGTKNTLLSLKDKVTRESALLEQTQVKVVHSPQPDSDKAAPKMGAHRIIKK